MTTNTMVRLTGVSKSYPGLVTALQDVDLSLERGELAAILGPSGSGKSTLLNIIGTLDRPTSGTVEIAGHVVGNLKDTQLSALRARHLGFVFQAFHLMPGVTALDTVADGLLYRGISRPERRSRAEKALRRVGLGERLRHRAHQLSGGQKQRVAIARAIVGEPDLLLADEPTGALDSASGAAVLDLLLTLHSYGITVVVITHAQEVAQRFPRRIVVRDGVVTQEQAPVRSPS